MKKVIGMTMLFIGTLIGAGFASGRELVQFFGGFNIASALFICFAGLIFYLVCMLFLRTGSLLRARGDAPSALFGRAGIFFDLIINLNYFIVIAAMLSGVDAALGLRLPIASLICAVLTIIVVLTGINGIVRFSVYLVPAIIVFILIISIVNIGDLGPSEDVDISHLFVSAISYASMNMLLAFGVLSEVELTSKHARIGSAAGTFAIVVLMILLCYAMTSSGALNAIMPVLFISKHPAVRVLAIIILLLAIFSTLISAAYPVARWGERLTGKKKISAIAAVACGYLLSLIGFDKIVGFFYPITGIIGLILICAAILYNHRYTHSKADI